MKKFLFLWIITLFCVNNAYPQKKFTTVVESIKKYGAMHIADTLVKKDLTIYGSAHIDNSKIKNITSIYGSAHISTTTLNMLDLHGSGNFNQITVKGAANIHGGLHVSNSEFKAKLSIFGAMTANDTTFPDLFISAKQTTLNNCKAQTIEIDADANTWRISLFGFCLYEKKYPSCLELNKSIIEGDIIFKGSEGKVIVDSSTVIKGKVINGVIVKK